MSELFESYLKKQDLSVNTIASYKWNVNHFITNCGVQ